MAEHRIEDAGEIVHGARKHEFGHGLTHADLEGLTPEEAAAIVTKDKVWPQPDWSAMVANGVDPIVAAMSKIVRDRLPRIPNMNGQRQRNRAGETIRAEYIDMITTIRNAVQALESKRDGEALQQRVLDAIGYYTKGRQHPEVRNLLAAVDTRHNNYAFGLTFKDLQRAERMVRQGFPAATPVPAWLQGVRFRRDLDGTVYAIRNKKVLTSGHADESACTAALEADWNAAQEKKRNAPKEPPVRIAVLEAKREGLPDHRNGRDVSSEDFIATFGFRGVQFGHSIPDGERQTILNTAHDALLDLCDVLGMPPRAISLDGFLAAAFGARGRGRFPAHYEPTRRIFNIGRLNGAGSLAHEWAHALDNACGMLADPRAGRGEIIEASAADIDFSRFSSSAANAWKDLMTDIFARPKTRDEFLSEIDDRINTVRETIKRNEERLDIFRSSGRKDRTFEKKMDRFLTDRRQALLRMQEWREDLASGRKEPGRTPSEFAKEAIALCGKSGEYWKRRNEMFARAFESFVYDRIVEHGGRSDYLVAGVEEDRFADRSVWRGNPYPTGDERIRIGKRMEAMLEQVMPLLTPDTGAEAEMDENGPSM